MIQALSRMEIALAEFLRRKTRRLHNSYTLAFEAAWIARGASDAESKGANEVSSSEWVKCTERLPGSELDGRAVLVAINHHRQGRITDCDVWNTGRQKGRFAFWGDKVTHWQPPPALPGDER